MKEGFLAMLRLRQSASLLLDRLDLFPKALQTLVLLLVIYQTAAEGEHVPRIRKNKA